MGMCYLSVLHRQVPTALKFSVFIKLRGYTTVGGTHMFRVFDKQSTGKTKKLVTFAKENNCTIICSMPLRMQDKAIRYGVGHVDCISYEDFLKMFADKSIPQEGYVID